VVDGRVDASTLHGDDFPAIDLRLEGQMLRLLESGAATQARTFERAVGGACR